MKRKIAHLFAWPLAIVFAGLVAQGALAEEAADPGNETLTDALLSCNKWMNCDTESPNYTGLLPHLQGCKRPGRLGLQRFSRPRVSFATPRTPGMLPWGRRR